MSYPITRMRRLRRTEALRRMVRENRLSRDDLILPLKFTKLLLRDGEIVYGQSALNLQINEVGESITIKVPVTHQLKQIEEEGRLTYKLDYELTKRVRDSRLPNGSYSYREESVREEFENRFTTRIKFVQSGVE